MPIEAQPLTGVFAAEVHGLDLVNLDGDDLAQLRALMCEHEVLVVRGQTLLSQSCRLSMCRLGVVTPALPQ